MSKSYFFTDSFRMAPKDINIINVQSVYETEGMGCINKMFKLFGFSMDGMSGDDKSQKKTSRCWPLICFSYIGLLTGVVLAFVALFDWMFANDFSVSHLCLWLGLYVSSFLVFAIYSHICFTLSRFAFHMQTFGLLMYKMHLHDSCPSLPKRFRNNSILAYTFSVIIATCMTAVCVIFLEILYVNDKVVYTEIIICRIQQVALCFWIIVAATFYYFITFTQILFCKLLLIIADIYVTNHNDSKQKIAQLLHRHQFLTILVRHLDAMFSTFMMATLIYELIVIIVFIQLVQSGFFSYTTAPIAVFNVFQLIMLIVKNVVCSNLNEKLKSSLTLRNVPNTIEELENCSAN
ncbi:hypothetical protein CHUAL_013677 [Chamberlinius hualienensis]